MMQGGGGSNGTVGYPVGASFTGDKPALSAASRSPATTPVTNPAPAGPSTSLSCAISRPTSTSPSCQCPRCRGCDARSSRRYYARPTSYSYFVGCSTGGREGMILSQRFPSVFNGIVSGDPAMRTGLSNLAIGQWIPSHTTRSPRKTQAASRRSTRPLTDSTAKSSWTP